MSDLIILLAMAVSGIIGYRLMGGIDRFLDRHVSSCEHHETES